MVVSVAVSLLLEPLESPVNSFEDDAVSLNDLDTVLDQSFKACDIFSSLIVMRLLEFRHVFAGILYKNVTNPQDQCKESNIQNLNRPGRNSFDAFKRIINYLAGYG